MLRAAELATVNKELETFNYTVAHDLRQPLNNISLFCQTINMLCTGQLDEECSGYVQMIHKTTQRMNNIIGALLDFSRLGHLAPPREIVDLSQLAREVVAMLHLATPDREVEIRIAEGVTAFADATLMRMDNLLGNAWKYTVRQDNAVIEFGIRELEGTPAYFVRDNGPGFENTDADKLFTPFQRLPNTEEFKGFGIGLATVERIIGRHDGRVWAEGKPGEAATFYFTLPDTPIQ